MHLVFVDPPHPPLARSSKNCHGGYGEVHPNADVKEPTLDLFHTASLPGHGLRWLNSIAVFGQLLWIHGVERIRVWHYYLICHQHLKGLVGFTRIFRIKPVVTLA